MQKILMTSVYAIICTIAVSENVFATASIGRPEPLPGPNGIQEQGAISQPLRQPAPSNSSMPSEPVGKPRIGTVTNPPMESAPIMKPRIGIIEPNPSMPQNDSNPPIETLSVVKPRIGTVVNPPMQSTPVAKPRIGIVMQNNQDPMQSVPIAKPRIDIIEPNPLMQSAPVATANQPVITHSFIPVVKPAQPMPLQNGIAPELRDRSNHDRHEFRDRPNIPNELQKDKMMMGKKRLHENGADQAMNKMDSGDINNQAK